MPFAGSPMLLESQNTSSCGTMTGGLSTPNSLGAALWSCLAISKVTRTTFHIGTLPSVSRLSPQRKLTICMNDVNVRELESFNLLSIRTTVHTHSQSQIMKAITGISGPTTRSMIKKATEIRLITHVYRSDLRVTSRLRRMRF